MLSGENLLKNRKNPETVIHSGQGGIYRRGHPPSYLECLSLQDFKNIAHVEFSGEFVCVCAFLFVFQWQLSLYEPDTMTKHLGEVL